jgi:transcriptional regulator with GAF, ATPase, and Fis domain
MADGIRQFGHNISEESNEVSIAAAMKAGARFGLKEAERKTILDQVFSAIRNWRKTAKQLGIKASTIDAYVNLLSIRS